MKMRKFDDLRNAEELRNELVEVLIRHDINRYPYQTDIYLYEDEDGSGRLVEFENVSGNSWLDDDHMLVTEIHQRYDSIYDYCEGDIGTLAAWCGVEASELINQVADWLGNEHETDDVILGDVTYDDCVRYVDHDEDLSGSFASSVEDWIRSVGFCSYEANNIIDQFDDALGYASICLPKGR